MEVRVHAYVIVGSGLIWRFTGIFIKLGQHMASVRGIVTLYVHQVS